VIVGRLAAAELFAPKPALQWRLGFGADIFARIGSAVGFAERVPAGNERTVSRHSSPCERTFRGYRVPQRLDRASIGPCGFT
jgi:hypothetical protein